MTDIISYLWCLFQHFDHIIFGRKSLTFQSIQIRLIFIHMIHLVFVHFEQIKFGIKFNNMQRNMTDIINLILLVFFFQYFEQMIFDESLTFNVTEYYQFYTPNSSDICSDILSRWGQILVQSL